MHTDVSELDLIARATSGDRCALEDLLLAHCSSLSRHIAPKVPSSVSVDDVVQQTLVAAYRNIERFKPRTAHSFAIWLRTIAECQLADTVKALTRKKRGGDYRQVEAVADSASTMLELVEMLSDQGRSPSQSVMRREAIHAVRIGIASLPDEQRKAITLRFLQGKDLDETAALMGRSRSAVRSLIHRAKQKLREALGRSSRWLEKK